MKIGVICEGPTDFYAISFFFGHSLEKAGHPSTFIAIQPEIDRTQPEGGWGNVLLWLKRNPPSSRVRQYFGGGLFTGALRREVLDCILIQLDSDVLGDASFQKYVGENFGYLVENSNESNERGDEVRKILEKASRFDEMTLGDVGRHVLAPAVESTETWCLAAFSNEKEDFEALKGEGLVIKFMSAMERCERRIPKEFYAEIDKSVSRRKNFCETHAGGSSRIIRGCSQFERIHADLLLVAPK